MIDTLDDFYSSVNDLQRELVRQGRDEDSEALDAAVSGSTTSGEAVEGVWLILSRLDRTDLGPATVTLVRELNEYIDRILGPRSGL